MSGVECGKCLCKGLVRFLDENESGARKVWANRNNADHYVGVRAPLPAAVFLLPEPTPTLPSFNTSNGRLGGFKV